MLRLSLKDWIVKGALGPLRVGATQAELLTSVGHPDQAGCPDEGIDTVWKYGDIELLFSPHGPSAPSGSVRRPYRVFCVEMHAFDGVPTGGRKIRLDPWIVRSELPREQMLRALDRLGVAYREEVPANDDNQLQVVVHDEPRLHLDFMRSERASRASGPDLWRSGLYGVWQTG